MIDFNKPIECDKGKLTLIAYDGGRVNVKLTDDDNLDYWVHNKTGNPLSVHLGLAGGFTVRNSRTVEEMVAQVIKDMKLESRSSAEIAKQLKELGFLAKD